MSRRRLQEAKEIGMDGGVEGEGVGQAGARPGRAKAEGLGFILRVMRGP